MNIKYVPFALFVSTTLHGTDFRRIKWMLLDYVVIYMVLIT